jgi:DNA invertase Pin-like site-specific DNA recombinase
MAEGKFVAYYRVSTRRQSASGLGVAAQQEAVHNYLDGGKWSIIAGFTEVESGKSGDRPRA